MMTEEHRLRHVELHRYLDELVADYIDHTGGLPSKTTVMQLVEWSYRQTKLPSEKKP